VQSSTHMVSRAHTNLPQSAVRSVQPFCRAHSCYQHTNIDRPCRSVCSNRPPVMQSNKNTRTTILWPFSTSQLSTLRHLADRKTLVPQSTQVFICNNYNYYITPFSGLFSGTTWVSRYQKGETSLDLNEAGDDRVLGCSGISWTIYKQSAPCSRQVTTPTPQHLTFIGRMLFNQSINHAFLE